MEGEELGGGAGQGLVIRRAEIDTSAPFRSVKEAVMLFGERVLAGELYANKLKSQMDNGESQGRFLPPARLGTVTAELEETKQSLLKAQEQSLVMVTCLSSLQEELERTKRELRQLKVRETEKRVMESETDDEDLKFIEDSTTVEVKTETTHERVEFQKKRYVTFANPPSLAKVMIPPEGEHTILERHPSLKKKKKKPLLPFIGGIFSRKRGGATHEIASA